MRNFIEGFRVGFRSRLAFRVGPMFHFGWKLGRWVKGAVG